MRKIVRDCHYRDLAATYRIIPPPTQKSQRDHVDIEKAGGNEYETQ